MANSLASDLEFEGWVRDMYSGVLEYILYILSLYMCPVMYSLI